MTKIGHLLRHAVLLEIAIWKALGRWVARRPDVPAGATAVGYGQLSGPVMWLWSLASFAEVIALELILRSIDAAWADAVRIPLFIVGVWGAFWMLGMLGSLHVRKHLVLDDRLEIRNGPRFRLVVPRDAVIACRAAEHEWEGMAKTVHEDDGLLLVGPSNRTNVELTLAGPTELTTPDGVRTADRVGLWVDEPRAFVRLLQTTPARPGA